MNSVDYSLKSSWYRLPEITKDVDTFYIYSTMYFGANVFYNNVKDNVAKRIAAYMGK